MLYLNLEKKERDSYSRQIFLQIREKILTGELCAGEQLPSTRALSGDLGISRNTVLTAYEMLVSEGFLQGVSGSGFYISSVGGQNAAISKPQEMFDYYAPSTEKTEEYNSIQSFDVGVPALDLFPRKKWSRALSDVLFEAPDSVLGYDVPQGRYELRAVLSDYLKKNRGILCHPDQILITTGAKQAISLIAKTLLSASSHVWIEEPSNVNLRRIFAYHTPHIFPIPVDEKGIMTGELMKKAEEDGLPALFFTTPSHQFPMGGILPIDRRLELIEFAGKSGCYIIEDDYDSEFRYDGIPTRSLFELNQEHVVYVGTFSKIMFPSLRLGYMVLPETLVSRCRNWKRLDDHYTSSISQLALMRFIENGSLNTHINRMKRLYLKRRNYLIHCLNELFPKQITLYGINAGMHIVVEFQNHTFSANFLRKAQLKGLRLLSVAQHAIRPKGHENQLILGYAHMNEEEIHQNLVILKSLLFSSK